MDQTPTESDPTPSMERTGARDRSPIRKRTKGLALEALEPALGLMQALKMDHPKKRRKESRGQWVVG
ncbi:hypothetical protein Q3G72_024805 [Acer saccharum]|nr:hypothetical protein Q3G72_024805 [Acer saccharum]